MRKTILLLSLSGLGTGCAYAALGVAVFARVPDPAIFGWVYFGFGAAAGLCCTVLRLGAAGVAAQGAAAAVPAPAIAMATPLVSAAAAAVAEPEVAAAMPAPDSAAPAAGSLRPAAAVAMPSTRTSELRVSRAAGFASSAFGAL
jgi:hypothetical protein